MAAKTFVLHVRISQKEREKIQEASGEVPVSTWVRSVILRALNQPRERILCLTCRGRVRRNIDPYINCLVCRKLNEPKNQPPA